MEQSEYPLVSCIMPTANREKFIPQAIHYFLRQDYPNKELIVVDDGAESVEQLIVKSPSIKYIRVQQPMSTIGEKRNYACSNSNGEIIAHWDDDDWYAKNWLTNGVNSLLKTNSDICGLKNVFFFSPAEVKFWEYMYPLNEKPWVCGATMFYKKDLWRKYPFRNMRIGEDNNFVWNAGGKIFSHSFMEGFVSIIHPNNTSRKRTSSRRWQMRSIHEIHDILNQDFVNYLK